ncbi:HIT domain-containing protein [Rheinheimera sp.]|uniref:HIT domain-containing protein n=1 Tax=Rheinheimera sp. TaxID=1869214 RepID=UPI00307DA65E
MNAELGCIFCDLSLKSSNNPWDQVLDETDSYSVYPTKGALLPGWQLVVPKKHVLNSSLLTEQEIFELEALIQKRAEFAHTIYGKGVVIFEHGPNIPNCKIGCGVDHAHIHIVPVPFDFEDAVIRCEYGDRFKLESYSISEFLKSKKNEGNHPYWFFTVFGSRNLYHSKTIPNVSQLFRKIIATRINMPDLYDYKKHLFLENIEKTIYDFGIIQ